MHNMVLRQLSHAHGVCMCRIFSYAFIQFDEYHALLIRIVFLFLCMRTCISHTIAGAHTYIRLLRMIHFTHDSIITMNVIEQSPNETKCRKSDRQLWNIPNITTMANRIRSNWCQ